MAIKCSPIKCTESCNRLFSHLFAIWQNQLSASWSKAIHVNQCKRCSKNC